MIGFAQAGVHLKYQQSRSFMVTFTQSVEGLKPFFGFLNTADNDALRNEAAEGLERAFSEAMDSVTSTDPALAIRALISQHGTMKVALASPAARPLSIYVADAWSDLMTLTELTYEQKQVAEYWANESVKAQKEAKVSEAPQSPASKGKPGRKRNR